MMFALLGIHEYYELTGDENAKYLFDKGIISLKDHLSDYDAGGWTYYDALGNPASKGYHHIHVKQLSQLYNITKDPYFKKYHDKWKNYEDNPPTFFIRFISQPSKSAIAIYISNVLALFIVFEIIVLCAVKIKRS